MSAIPNDEKSFDIPNNWKWVRLGEIGIITSGGTPRKAETSYWEDADIPWITPAIMSKAQNNVFFDNDSVGKINQKGLNNSSAQLISANSIVVSSRAPIGYINIVPFDYTTNQGCKSISTFSEIDNKYIYYAIKFSVPDMYKRASGTTFKEISGTRFGETVIPLPPLEEQKRIVVKIEKLMPLVDEYAESYNRLQKIDNEFEDKLKQSVLQYAMEGKLVKQNPNDEPASELIKKIENEKNELVKESKISKLRKASPISDEEKAFRIPNNWKWVRLEEIAQLNTGTTPSIGKSRYEGNYIPFIKPGDISSKGINYNNFGLSKDGLRHGRLIDENSLLTVCIGGSTGKTYYTDRAISCNQQINASTPYKGVSVMFLFYEMLSNHFQEEIHQHASGSATPIINKTKFGNLCLPLPPLEEQKRIVAKIEKIMNSINNH